MGSNLHLKNDFYQRLSPRLITGFNDTGDQFTRHGSPKWNQSSILNYGPNIRTGSVNYTSGQFTADVNYIGDQPWVVHMLANFYFQKSE